MTPGSHATVRKLITDANLRCLEERNEIFVYNTEQGIVDRIMVIEQGYFLGQNIWHLKGLVALSTNVTHYEMESHICSSDIDKLIEMAFTSCERFNARLFLSINGVKKRV